MYIMIITFLFYGDPAKGQFSSSVESVLFSSKESCETARSSYLSGFTPIADELTAVIKDGQSVGDFRGPAGVEISAICVAQ